MNILQPVLLLVVLISSVHCDWVESSWIPRHGVIYDANTIQKTLRGRCILVIGDSLGRRLGATLFAAWAHNQSIANVESTLAHQYLLAGGHSHWDYDFSKHSSDQPSSSCLTWLWAPTFVDVLEGKHDAVNLTRYSDIIVAMGIHDAQNVVKYHEPPQLEAWQNQTCHTLRLSLEQLIRYPPVNLIWRSAPYAWSAGNNNTKLRWEEEDFDGIDSINHCARREIERLKVEKRIGNDNNPANKTLINYVAFHESLMGRDYGPNRLTGDSPEHLDDLARFIAVQEIVYEMRRSGNMTELREYR